jgi:glycosyltransferase
LKEKVEAVYGDLRYIGNTGKNEIVRVWKAGAYKPNFFYKGWMPPHPTFYVRREVYQKFGSFNTQLKFAADYELMLRFILKHQITLSYIPEFLVKMRVGGASNRNLSNRIKANIEDRKAWKLVEIKPGFLTLVLKPLKKIFQYSIFNQSWNKHQ